MPNAPSRAHVPRSYRVQNWFRACVVENFGVASRRVCTVLFCVATDPGYKLARIVRPRRIVVEVSELWWRDSACWLVAFWRGMRCWCGVCMCFAGGVRECAKLVDHVQVQMRSPDSVSIGHGEELMLVGVDAACAEQDVLGKVNVRGAWVST